MNVKHLVAAAIATAVVAPSLAQAQTPVAEPTYQHEKCYGVARAGGNDCASTGNNVCGGTSRRDGDPRAWVYMPRGVCARIVGASLTPR